MTATPAMPHPAGWFGKLPILGDFAQRRLPHDVVERWDAWLQAGITDSRAALGEAWLDNYLTAHVWHFVLMPGVLGAHAWAGVWMPSVDRVGRYFPLTLLAPLPAEQALGSSTSALGNWLLALEDIARLGLRLEHDVAPLEEALTKLGPPPVDKHGAAVLKQVEAALGQRAGLIPLPRAGLGSQGNYLDALATASLLPQLAGYSLWWCYDADGVSGGFAHRSLPDASFVLKMITYSPTD